jgi:Zn-dependent alcohol dehydrogenase
VGPGVEGLAPGDRVVLTPVPPCGVCYGCLRGEPGVCVSVQGMLTSALPDGRTGLSRKGEIVYRGVNLGAFAEYVLLPATGAVKVAADAPLESCA